MSRLRGLRLYTPSFTVPHKKKSSGVRSGERAGNSIGPFRFEGTVTGINYLTMLADSIFPAIRALYGNDDFYFQLDGAPPHYHRDVRAYLDKNLSGQWIGRRGPIEFPARSPDLTPLDFFLWGTVKDGVYKRKPRNLDILWNEIQAVCREISLDVLIRCTESVVTRTQNCIDAAGHQFEQFMPWLQMSRKHLWYSHGASIIRTNHSGPPGKHQLMPICHTGDITQFILCTLNNRDLLISAGRTCIKFCVKNEIKCADAFQMLTVAYGEATLDRSNVYRWYKMFSEDREDVNDEERAGRPSTSTTDEKINEVEKMILANRRITVREVAEDLNILIGSCHSIFINDLGMRRVAAKFVPKLLNCDQKQHRMNIANEMLDSVRNDPNLLQRVITGDEAWVYGYDVETKAQSSQWKLPHEPRPKKARQVRANVKVLLTVFFDCRGVVHHEFLPQGRTVNKEYYLQVMRNLREAIRQKRPDLWKNKNWLLHHDNTPAHTSLLVRDFLAKNNTLMMPQPPYSPDLAPCDFFLFPKLKRPMKGRRYATLDEIKTASKEELKKILKNDF
ncbi:hypothetical protein LAZ67_1003663 [Cordylochernes scorpioides]|uniref:Transposase n=1 Tax=Cordylochernes scorpioides TaxID=51811 RepID=A0ABY6JYH2_9ARAC|nr:hypothetical protein LAZ67_1003663 [Cordylochernes scorpioides]